MSEQHPRALEGFILRTETSFGWLDRLRIFLGRRSVITIYGDEALIDRPEVLEALDAVRTEVYVEPLRAPRVRVAVEGPETP